MEFAQTTETLYEDFTAKLKRGDNFSFARFGDGEMSCILRRPGVNCDNHAYFPDLGDQLKTVLLSKPDYFVGMQRKGLKDLPMFSMWLQQNGLSGYIDADVFHDANMRDGLGKFWLSLRGRDIVAVGPVWFRLLPPYKMEFTHVVVPQKNAWLDYRTILERVREKAKDVVTVSMGMGGKVLIDDLHRSHPDLTILDMGSALDVWCGITTRRYHTDIMHNIGLGMYDNFELDIASSNV